MNVVIKIKNTVRNWLSQLISESNELVPILIFSLDFKLLTHYIIWGKFFNLHGQKILLLILIFFTKLTFLFYYFIKTLVFENIFLYFGI